MVESSSASELKSASCELVGEPDTGNRVITLELLAVPFLFLFYFFVQFVAVVKISPTY